MNWLAVVTVVLSFAAYALGHWLTKKIVSGVAHWVTAFVFSLLAAPAIVYDVYYTGLLGEPIWLYRVRTIPGTELLAAAGGFLAGWAQIRIAPRLRLSPAGRRFLVPVVFGFAIALPYLKPVFRPMAARMLEEKWIGDACLQSTPSTCGPASAATIARRLGGDLSERSLALESFTCRSGTENWYLARSLRRHGFATDFVLGDPKIVRLPAIAGVKLRSLGNSGHFIALLDRMGETFVVADPMEGMATNSLADLQARYEFTGFFLVIHRAE